MKINIPAEIKVEIPRPFVKAIKNTNISKMCRETKINRGYLYRCINNEENMSWKTFRALQDYLKLEKRYRLIVKLVK